MFKMFSGRRTCSCKEHEKGNQLSADTVGKSLDLVDRSGRNLGGIAYIRGLDNPRHTAIEPIRQAVLDTATLPPPSSESSSEESRDGDGDADNEAAFHGFEASSSSEEADDTPEGPRRPARQRRTTSTRDDLLDEADHDGRQGARPHAPPNTPNTTPPTDAAQEAMPSEEEAPAQEFSPKTNQSGRRRDQMPYKPRRYKGRRSR